VLPFLRLRAVGGKALSSLATASRSPLAWVLAGTLVLHAIGIGWGLPASDGWDNDGIAPRDFLAGLVETVSPGKFFQYPPVHLALLALLTAPVTMLALVRAPSLAPTDVVAEMIKVPTMTSVAVAARVVSLAMSLGIAWSVARIAEELRGRRAGWCAAAFVGVCAPLTYYAHTTNLDVPYLFWGCLALLALVRAVTRDEPKLLRRWAVFAALAVATKDQAYALFLVAAPVAIGGWWLLSSGLLRGQAASPGQGIGRNENAPPREELLRESALAMVLGASLVLAVDGAVYNPHGFAARVRFLLGPASQDYAQYTSDWLGRMDVVADTVSGLSRFYPWALWAVAAAGLVVQLASRTPEGFGPTVDERREARRALAALLPLLVAVSFLVSFNCVARRTDERFALPQATVLAVYGGVGLDAILGLRRAPAGWSRHARSLWACGQWTARAFVAACFAWALFLAAAVDVNLLWDPRYDAEAWLRERVRPTDTVETYGLNVYMPRFPSGCRVTRVGPLASDHRSPMPGVEEVVKAYDGARDRAPRFIVLSQGWAWRYLLHESDFPTQGRVMASIQRRLAEDPRATAYFQDLVGGQIAPYRLVHTAAFESRLWPRVDLHASTGREIWVFERAGGG
jgi:hypothetical protein